MSLFVSIGVWYFALVIIAYIITVITGSVLIASNYHVQAFCGNPAAGNNIALTFDDGPDVVTPAILEVLKKFDAKATFFCIGSKAENNPEIVHRIVDDGHLIGNHSYSHSDFFDFFRKDRVVDELRQTDGILEKTTGRKIKLFRPPYGITNPSIMRALKVTGHHVIGWNIRSLDTVIKDENTLLSRIKNRIKPGGIVLLHDTSMHSVGVLEQLLIFLRDNNYKVVSLEQLLNIKAYEN